MEPKSWGQMVKQWRLERGLSQMALARLVGVSLVSIRLWEADVSRPRPANELRLMEIMGKS